MLAKIRDIGNSRGILLPARMLADLRLRSGDAVEVFQDADRIVLAPRQSRRMSLAEAIARIDAEDGEAMADLADR